MLLNVISGFVLVTGGAGGVVGVGIGVVIDGDGAIGIGGTTGIVVVGDMDIDGVGVGTDIVGDTAIGAGGAGGTVVCAELLLTPLLTRKLTYQRQHPQIRSRRSSRKRKSICVLGTYLLMRCLVNQRLGITTSLMEVILWILYQNFLKSKMLQVHSKLVKL